MKKIAITTLGCKINQYESACIIDKFKDNGYTSVDFSQSADVYVINTCTVTNRTDFKSRNAVRKALAQKELNPDVKIIVTGCYAQRFPNEIKKIGIIDYIIDNNNKNHILDVVSGKEFPFDDIFKYDDFSEQKTSSMMDKARAFVKIQDGCNFYCAYCAIPYARGKSRSREKENVLKQIISLVDNGYREIVLGGINLGLYGKDFEENYGLTDLLWDLEKIDDLKRIRLSSLEPQLFTKELFNYFKKSEKICPHFHIPLQAGCNELLKSMKRRYTTDEFKNLVKKLKEIFPDVAIGIDIIVGLPGETDELFNKTKVFLESLEVTYFHVFPYSVRPGTEAEKMKGFVKGDVQKIRCKKLQELSRKKTEQYQQHLVKNKVKMNGVIEKKIEKFWTALSDHFIRVYIESDMNLSHSYQKFIPIRLFKDGIEVKIID